MENFDRIIQAVTTAALLKPELLTGDSLNALVGGHGMLNLAVFCAANAIAEKAAQGRSLKIKALNQAEIEMDEVVEAGVDAAKAAGADADNAALITAALCYLAGSNVRAGVPSGNRKLGALARLKAGTPRGGVMLLPTPKANNKISAFPAVLKIYEAMMAGRLTQINGADLPAGIGGSPLVGHSTLGEDVIFPEIAENGAAIGTAAMLQAYAGAGMKPNPFIAAIFGAAAILEIVHPDALMPEKYGSAWGVYTPYVAGLGAIKAAGLPARLHFRVTNEEFDTAALIGDLGIIMKDMGTPTVVGMLAFYEIFGCFQESPLIGAGSSGGPRTAPIGHAAADASLALRTLALTGSMEKAAEVVAKNKEGFVDPEYASIEVNIVSRKVEELRAGPVSKAVILATTGATRQAIRTRITKTLNELNNGKALIDLIAEIEADRIVRVAKRSSDMMSAQFNKNISIKINKIKGGARRPGRTGLKFYVLDPDIDLELTVDDEKFIFTGLAHRVIPQAVMTKDMKTLEVLPLITLAVGELLVSGHTLIDLVVPVATAVLAGHGSAEELAKQAAGRGSLATGGLPGGEERAVQVARLAVQAYQLLGS